MCENTVPFFEKFHAKKWSELKVEMLRVSDFADFSEDGIKVKIPSEIKPPLRLVSWS